MRKLNADVKRNAVIFGKRLRNQREQKGLTRKNVANACGVDVSTVSRWESGEIVMKINRIKQLSNVLGVTAQTLCDWFPDEEEP